MQLQAKELKVYDMTECCRLIENEMGRNRIEKKNCVG